MKFIAPALCYDGLGNTLLSSDLFAEFDPEIKRSGPPTPFIFGPIRLDRVSALRCHSTVLLKQWAERPRHWPPPDVVKKVIYLGACLTPAGFKDSPYKHVEWRICFNSGETEIVNSLTDTQLKVYVMLKMIVKDELRP
ncbi:hypothetical protein DPMN_066607 [Dreissena polymorpha]|uniref:Uncharacterized protein n=1 Tax=Dreissena polymorpha TaxID=45954 RepID=A0A9D4BV58_DREPO|nr:hypothetical protein DPMN_066607 [Dreissena polymorpha]